VGLVALALLSCTFLSGLGLSAMLVIQHQSRQERLKARFVTVLEPHARPRARALPPLVLASRRITDHSPGTILLRLFGIDRARTAHLPARWYILLAVSLFTARILALVVQMMAGSWGLLLWPVLWLLVSRSLFGFFDQRHTRALFTQFPDALAMIVRAVRIGIPVSQAVQLVATDSPAPTSTEFVRLSEFLSVGKPLDEAMTELAERNGLPEYRFFAAALTLQNQTGGGLATTLENLADVIRKRVYARAKGYALAAEARMSALVLTILPVFTFFALLLVSPVYIRLLIETESGHKVLGLAIALLGTGQFCMRTLIRKSLS